MFLKAGLSKRTPLGLFLALLFSAVLLGSLLQGFVNAPKAFATTCDRLSATQLINCNGTGADSWNNTGNQTGVGVPQNGSPPPVDPKVDWRFVACGLWGNGKASTNYYPTDKQGYSCMPSAISQFSCPPSNGLAAYGVVIKWTRTSVTSLAWEAHYDTATCVYPWSLVTSTVTPVGGGNGRCLVKITENLYYGGTSSTTIKKTNGGVLVAGPQSKNGDLKETGTAGMPGVCKNGAETTLDWSPTLPKYSTASTAICSGKADGSSCRGYYRIDQVNRYRDCTAKSYPAWTGQPTSYSCGKAYNLDVAPEYYTNSCKYGVQRDLDYNADFDPDACNNKWTCTIPDTTINGQNTKSAVTAIRNGSPLTVKVPSIKFGGSGVVASSITNMKSVTKVVADSTPYNADATVNSKAQYFYLSTKKNATDTGAAQVKFNVAADVPYSATTVLKATDYLFFYWASDPKGVWQAKTTYTFDGYFYGQNNKTLNGATTSIKEWKEGASFDQADSGDTYSLTPKVTVVRSVTHE